VALVLFMRAVNVGGNQVFRPTILARKLAHLGVINIGAAGTFVVTRRVRLDDLRAEVLKRVSFPVEMIVCRGKEVFELVASNPYPDGRGAPRTGVRRFVMILARRPRKMPRLPYCAPERDRWEVKIFGVHGRFALSFFRLLRRSFLVPSTIAEQAFGIRTTTRSWSTIVKIHGILKSLT
jgi:uncharacterized protein (DUF1697 family)